MKKILLIAALATVALVQAQPSEAYFRGNWCAKMDRGGGSVGERCDFPTFATCRAYIAGESRSFCVQNQWQAGNWGVRTAAPSTTSTTAIAKQRSARSEGGFRGNPEAAFISGRYLTQSSN